jgi:hypothetical protein
MDPADFSDKEPQLVLEDYFLGNTSAWGIFQDRFGNLRRQFEVEIVGSMDDGVLVLDERFIYDDGERETRVWRIDRLSEGNYVGIADDVVGMAVGRANGNALNWKYDLDLKVGKRTWRVHFDDWMFLQSDGVLINRAKVTKFGLEIGEVTIFFSKKNAAVSANNDVLPFDPIQVSEHTRSVSLKS